MSAIHERDKAVMDQPIPRLIGMGLIFIALDMPYWREALFIVGLALCAWYLE